MKKLFERLIVFFIGFPLLLSLIIFFPQYNHLLLNLVIIAFSMLGACEFKNILSKKNLIISTPESIILGGISPAAWTVVVSFGVAGNIVPGAYILGASWLLVSRILTPQEKLASYVGRTAAGFSVMIYPGLFMAWIVQMAVSSEASYVIIVFFLIVLLNDSAAWFFGLLFGKNNRGIIPASPNKSIAGFSFGIAVSLLIGILAVLFLPKAFTSDVMPSIPAGAILGFFAGIASTLGDLGESALKRSAGVKDSSTLIMGRGGALDSIDSLALAAPVYYIIYQVLFR
jgi:phosphatidate cytidylyltransferase